MLKCAWCKKKIKENESLFGLNVKFNEEINPNKEGGKIIQVYIKSKNISVPMIVADADSEAKKHGQDGIFAVCSEKCGNKLREALLEDIRFKFKKFY
ncbi:hypothetical protein [Aceticella autotrophica]|nr:hypothetical protein [Aceticella autotrophica]